MQFADGIWRLHGVATQYVYVYLEDIKYILCG